jgi:hypothetical protein
MDERGLGMSPRSPLSGIEEDLDLLQQHYVNAYSAIELKTFHCERVRKMPLSGLDPSMLIGFFCRDESDWKDFKKNVKEVRSWGAFTFALLFTDLGDLPGVAGEETQGLLLDQRRTTKLAFGWRP